MPYEPDVWFLCRSGKRYIFEIFDSELKQIKNIIADVVRSLLAQNTSKVFFIIPTDSEEEIKKLLGTWDTLRETLIYSGFNEKLLPPKANPHIYYILKSEARSYRSAKKILEYLSKQDKW